MIQHSIYTQAANLINADNADIKASQSFALDGHDLTLKQKEKDGWQNLNEIYSEATVIDVQQTVGTGINNIVMDQEAIKGFQSINTIQSNEITQALQSVSANSTIRLKQQGDRNEQFANAVDAEEIENLTQTVMGGTTGITMDQNATNDASIQTLNNTTATNVTGTVKQTVSGNLEMNQGGASGGVADGSIQAANLYKASGSSTNIEQNLGSADNTITLTQTSSGSDTAQAGNLIDMTTDNDSAVLRAATQAISTTGTFSLIQTDSDDVVQAGNMLLTNSDGANSGGAVVQTVTVGALAMQQTNSDGSIQAANYVGELLSGG